MVMQLPEKDEVSHRTREQLACPNGNCDGWDELLRKLFLEMIKLLLEQSSDIEQATKRARAMVMRAGLSKELGPMALWRK